MITGANCFLNNKTEWKERLFGSFTQLNICFWLANTNKAPITFIVTILASTLSHINAENTIWDTNFLGGMILFSLPYRQGR